MKLYPMKLAPVTEEKTWGGGRIFDQFGIGQAGEPMGKAELVTSRARVENGEFAGLTVNQLASRFGEEFLGKGRKTFPYTLKLVDTHERRTPRQRHNLRLEGMFEHYDVMLLLHTEPGSGVYAGLREKLGREEFIRRAGDKDLYRGMYFYPARVGELFLLPGGLLHAQGGGILSLVLSVGMDEKQSEDLNAAETWEVLDPTIRGIKYAGKTEKDGNAELWKTEFGTGLSYSLVRLQGTRTEENKEKLACLFCLGGSGTATLGEVTVPVARGNALLIPAEAEGITLSGKLTYCYFC